MNMQIHHYSIEKLIREEVTGTMYLAVDIRSNTHVTLRLLEPLLVAHLSDQALLKNCHALLSLDHTSIGKFYTCFRQADQVYVVSEYIAGLTLREYMTACKGSEENLWDLLLQIIDAFDYAHSKGVNHFTINPDTIRFLAEGKIKVMDFGLANLFSHSLSKGAVELNQLQYRSPEQIQGKALEARSDIYSLGVIFFELLTKQSLYPAVLSETDIKHKILHHTLPPLKVYTSIFSHSYSMQAIIDKATAKSPAYRFENFLEVKQSLLQEKDERESLWITQLMQEVNHRSQTSALKQFLSVKLAKQKTSRKRIGQLSLLCTLMAGVIFIGLHLTSLTFNQAVIGLNKNAQRSKTVDTKDTQGIAFSEPAKKLSADRVENKASGEARQAVDSNKSHISMAEVNQKKTANAALKAGFSLETNSDVSQLQLQNRLESFYASLRTKDINQTNDYYAPILTQFFNESHVNEKSLHKLLQKAWKRTPEDKHEILWPTFQFSQDGQGNYIMEFYMQYTYRRAHRQAWRSRKIYTMIKMDKDLKIYYMSGD